jgi:prolyl-tRNA synthetase
MRMSRLFGQTLRTSPSEAEAASHQLLVRAGFIRPLASGIFSYLPLARRSLTKIENMIREEMNAIGGQEVTMPVVHPADLWKETRRWYQIGAELGRFTDRAGRDMALAMTHEEVLADLARKEIRSYRQLPQLVYHIQTKWRDDPRPRAGLIRTREFTMLDSYSLDADEEGMRAQYRAHYQAYFNIFNRCALPVIAVQADVGMMGGTLAHEFMTLTPIGEDTLMLCARCGQKANRQVARFRKLALQEESPRPVEKVATPNVKTIDELAAFLHLPKSKTAKAVFLVASVGEGEEATERLVFALVRGDMEVNETKLANAVKARELRPAEEREIRAVGAVPGYASPVGLSGALVVADDALPQAANLAAGANEEGYHLLNVNYGRDFEAHVVADIAAAQAGDACPECGEPLRAERGVEVGNIFQLGTRYSLALGCTFLDKEGVSKLMVMGSYGIGVGRLLACVAERHHDEKGLMWPISVAPYDVYLVALEGGREGAERAYSELWAAGVEVLYDDREDSAGVKFADADLIGVPLRLTLSRRSLERGGAELKPRSSQQAAIIPLEGIAGRVREEITRLEAAIASGVVTVPYTA